MTLRFLSSTTISDGLPSARRAVAVAVLALAGASAAYAAPDAASAAAADQAAPLTITVRPGQSLNDIAVAVTQSHDPGVLARAGRALFDANPQAFMKRDPSRLKIGAQLTVPALDATGAAAGTAASGAAASGAPAASAVSAIAGAASHAGASAAPAAASHPAASHAAAASGATAFAASGATGSAFGANGASAPGAASVHASSAAAQVVASAAQAAAPAASSGVGSAHVWSGSIQQAPAGANGASAAGAEALLAPGAASHGLSGSAAQAATGASQARPSSLQQLLALKNRVLMELQKHGIGKPAANVAPAPAPAAGSAQKPQASASAGTATSAPTSASASAEAAASEAAAGSATSAASASTATPPVSASPRAAAPQVPFNTGAAIAVGAAVVALIAGFALRRRKKGASADAIEPGAFTPAPALDPDAVAAIAGAPAGPDAKEEDRHDRDDEADRGGRGVTAAAAQHAPLPRGPEPSPAADEDAAPAREPQAPAVEPLTLKIPGPDEQGGAPHAPESTGDKPSGVPQTGAKLAPHAWRQAFPSDAIAALDSLDMPLPPRESTSTDADQAAQLQHAEPTDSRGAQSATNGPPAAHPPIGAENPRGAQTHGEAAGASDLDGVESFDDDARVAPRQTEGDAAGPGETGRDDGQAQAAPLPAGDVPQPPRATALHEAATPRIEPPDAPPAHAEPPSAAPRPPGASFAAPVPAEPGHAPAAQTANPPPLGVAQFGALNLDFDLELPSGPSASLPAFTPEALAKIARNKLELASEYVELGDLAGARTLLHEVIEADHADTRDEARVMLAKLADLS
ncbi:hypothetical protein I6G56_31980 [Burkholderia humptydooensis]|uniref:Uncharacterized protein n=3 Tax=Burkholderia humptydooensis TaxID=430531 RepID=A0A7U4P932_9BURK|nr:MULTISPECIES: FimV/HubP family polar landmark protein [Burkholderia]AJY38732.1 putative transmembrane protein [Burkholderia sp. 2002721687]ALX45202.1 hypothetical protein AQ610_22130 [Burkholderia humptydooensis]EIP85644.1 putative transmembrane protein [Burkholderia humptydooensis MSMB43]QPS46666.1 hypothetical protein I6G56_31980 [Burkholderia humptydooensis]